MNMSERIMIGSGFYFWLDRKLSGIVFLSQLCNEVEQNHLDSQMKPL